MAHNHVIGANHLRHTDRASTILQSIDNGTCFGTRINTPTQALLRTYILDVEDEENPQDANEAFAIYVMHTLAAIRIPHRCYRFFHNGVPPPLPCRIVYSYSAISERHGQIARYALHRDQTYNMVGQNGCVTGMHAHAMERHIAMQAGIQGPGVFPPLPDVDDLEQQIRQRDTTIANLNTQIAQLTNDLATARADLLTRTQELADTRRELAAERNSPRRDQRGGAPPGGDPRNLGAAMAGAAGGAP